MRYLLISFFRKKGGQIDEAIKASVELAESDVNTANVILDYADRKILKSVIEGEEVVLDFQKTSDYYHKVYPKLIDQLIKEAPITKGASKKKRN